MRLEILVMRFGAPVGFLLMGMIIDIVIGRKKEAVLQHMRTGMHAPFDMADGAESMCGCVVTIRRETGLAVSIERRSF